MPSNAGIGAGISKTLALVMSEYRAPGMGACILSSKEILGCRVWGVRKQGDETELQRDDRFHLGSCTKAMTATLLARLVEEGKLAWDSALGELLPSYSKIMHEKFKPVTLRQILQHRGGTLGRAIPRGAGKSDLAKAGLTRPQYREAYLRVVLSKKPDPTPGTAYSYSNSGYVVAGVIAENLCQKPFEDLLRGYIAEPLKMKTFGFRHMDPSRKISQPWEHIPSLAGPKPVDPDDEDHPAMDPAGMVHCSLSDWARFVQVHLAGARGAVDLLSQESFRVLHTPPEGQDYAMGWIRATRTWAKGMVLTHDGSNRRNFAVAWVAPKIDRAYLVTSNMGGDLAASACDTVASKLISLRS